MRVRLLLGAGPPPRHPGHTGSRFRLQLTSTDAVLGRLGVVPLLLMPVATDQFLPVLSEVPAELCGIDDDRLTLDTKPPVSSRILAAMSARASHSRCDPE